MKRALTICLLALLALPVQGAVEDFTTWTEVDAENRLNVSSSTVVATDVARSTLCYIYDDFTAGYFTDFEVRFQFKGGECGTTDDKTFLGAIVLGNAVADYSYHYWVNSVAVRWTRGPSGHYLSILHQPTTTSSWASSDGALTPGVTYHCRFLRVYDGGTNASGLYTMYVCTGNYYGDPGATLVQTHTVNVPAGEQAAFQYAFVAMSRKTQTAYSHLAGGTISNVEFFAAEPEPDENPPAKATGFSPADEATGVSPGTSLTWSAASGATSYDVYFGLATGDINDQFIDNRSSRSYLTTLAYATQYHWRINPKNVYGTTTGDVLTFTTKADPGDPGDPNEVIGAFQDLRTYVESDPESLMTIADANHVSVASMPGAGTYYLGKDFGPDYWSGNVTARWRSTLTAGSNGTVLSMFSLQNAMVGYRDLIYGLDAQIVHWLMSGTIPNVRLDVYDDGVTVGDSAALSLGTEYWFTFFRDHTAGMLYLYICTGAHYGHPEATLVDTLSVAIPAGEQNSYRYVMLMQNKSSAGPSATISGSLSHFDLGVPSELPPGTPEDPPAGDPNTPGDPGVHGPYYVSPYGSDDADGVTVSTPWRTLAYALDNAVLSATEGYNIIYLMAGTHAGQSITSKTWESTSWSNDWTIAGHSGAIIGPINITGIDTAYLTFRDLNIIQDSPHSTGASMFRVRNSSYVKLLDSTIRGYNVWTLRDNISGSGVAIETTSGGITQEVDVNGVDISYVERGIYVVQMGGANTLRNGIIVQNCTVSQWNIGPIGYDTSGPGNRSAYDPVIFRRIRGTEHTVANLGGVHGNGFSGRGDNFTLDGFVTTAFGGSGGIRLYDHAYPGVPFENITVENCLIYGSVLTTALFNALGDNVIIRNNTFLSMGHYSTTRPADRYLGYVGLKPSSAVTPNIQFHNNIVLGKLEIGATTNVTGDNNILWSVMQDGVWRSTGLDSNDVVVVSDGTTAPTFAGGYTATTFETQGAFFLGDSDWGTSAWWPQWDASAQNYTTPYVQHPDYTVFALAATSPAIGAAMPSKASTYDVIGTARDAEPDIGAYEYSTAAPPARARLVAPANGAMDVPVDTLLQWSGAATNYDLYVGAGTTALSYVGNTVATSWPYDLEGGVTYAWRVDANSTYGRTTGTVWSFSTGSTVPGLVSNPSPGDGTIGVSTSRTLSWSPASGASSYDVYVNGVFYLATPSTSVSITLSESTTYTWRVHAVNAYGITEGPLWTFTTGSGVGEPSPPTTLPPSSPGVRVRGPVGISGRPDWMTSRYSTAYESLHVVELIKSPGTPGTYIIDPYLTGYLERVVIVADGSDTQWSLRITDAAGATLFEATDLDMTAGPVGYLVDRCPFSGGLKFSINDTVGADRFEIYAYVWEVFTR